MEKLNRRACYDLISFKTLTPKEKRRAQKAIISLEQKITTKKLRIIMVLNEKRTREWLSRKDTSSPT